MNQWWGSQTRASRVAWLLLFILAIFSVRLFYIQVIKHKEYLTKADNMQTDRQVLPAVRGQIYVRDTDGNIAPLVLNRTVYTLFADPSEVKDANKARELVRRVAGDKLVQKNDPLGKLGDKNRRYVVLAQELTQQQAETIRKEKLSGLGLKPASQRVYPEGGLAAQTLGFVNADGKGQYGVEQALDGRLGGKAGLLKTVTDVSKVPLTIGTNDVSIPAKDGENIVLSIDRNVQSQAEETLAAGLKDAKATTGSMVVMDPQTGRVLAMANFPSYNPEQYRKVDTPAVYKNNVTMNAYEPGSVMKLFTVGAGLDSGAITPRSTFLDTGCVQVDDAKMCNVERNIDGKMMTPMNLLEYSLNTGAVWVLQQMGGGSINLAGRQKYYGYLTKNYRFNQPTGIELAHEADSVIFKPDMNRGPRVLYANMTFGQGEQLTMIQVISAFSAVINGGNYYKPTVVLGSYDLNTSKLTEQKPQLLQGNVLAPQHSYDLRDMLQQARYLGAKGKLRDNGYFVGGKSGTAQKIDPATGKYSHTLTTGTYIGFGADKTKVPKYAIMVRVDDAHNGGYAGSAAAQPIFDKMSNFMIQYQGVSK